MADNNNNTQKELLPKWKMIEQIGEGLWVLREEFSLFFMPIGNCMLIVKLNDDNDLAYINVINIQDAKVKEALKQIPGTPKVLLTTIQGHNIHIPAFQKLYPEAKVIGAKNIRNHIPKVKWDSIDLMEGEQNELWESVLEQRTFSHGSLQETWWFHKPTKTVYMTDLIQCLHSPNFMIRTAFGTQAKKPAVFTTIFTVLGVPSKDRPGIVNDIKKNASEILDTWSPDNVVFHHDMTIVGNGTEILKKALSDWKV